VPVRKKSGGPRRRSRSSAPERLRAPYAASASGPLAPSRGRAVPRRGALRGLEARAHATWNPSHRRPAAPRETLRSIAVLLCAGAATDAARRTASNAGRPPPCRHALALVVNPTRPRPRFRSTLPAILDPSRRRHHWRLLRRAPVLAGRRSKRTLPHLPLHLP
jgi:hypothetical protein